MITYRSSGVSIAANDELVERIQRSLRSTQDRRVIDNVNGFAGFYRLFGDGKVLRDPLLVGCSDGVGTKVLVAAKAGRLDTIGIDLVAMNVNDLVTSGAEPLFFLDYVALHKNDPRRTAQIVEGVASGCRQAGCTLLGGETAEMPDLYRRGEFDLAGFAVGVVEQKKLIDGRRIRPGDVIIGLASSGIHSNGYALVRKLFFEVHRYALSRRLKGLKCSLGAELLRPTRIYVKPIRDLLHKDDGTIRGLAHITGGGLVGNVPRILPEGCSAAIEKHSWSIAPIFRIIQSLGVAEAEMYRVFNMGIGMVAIVPRSSSAEVVKHFRRLRVPARVIGRITRGEREVELVEGAAREAEAPRS